MPRYVVLLKFTDTGVREVNDSPARAKRFAATLGEFDGVLQFRAPDEQTAFALVLSLHKQDNVRTQMLRAFDSDEFSEILERIPQS